MIDQILGVKYRQLITMVVFYYFSLVINTI